MAEIVQFARSRICHHALERFLDECIAAAGIAGDGNGDGALFRTTGRKTGQAQALGQQDAYRMIQRRAAAAGIKTRIGNHTFRAIGITAYLKHKGLLEHAQTIANHASPRTTKLYDRRSDEISLDGLCQLSSLLGRHYWAAEAPFKRPREYRARSLSGAYSESAV